MLLYCQAAWPPDWRPGTYGRAFFEMMQKLLRGEMVVLVLCLI